MSTIKRLGIVAAGALAIAITVPAVAVAGKPVIHEHFNFTSDPYGPFDLCGVAVTGVDTVVGQFSQDATGANIGAGNVVSVLTATASGKSIEFQQAGVSKGSALTDNGDGTVSSLLTISGLSPKVSVFHGPPLGIDAGEITFRLTFDASTGAFISFDVVSVKGPRPAGSCDPIVAALT